MFAVSQINSIVQWLEPNANIPVFSAILKGIKSKRTEIRLSSVDHGLWTLPHSEKADLLKWRCNFGWSSAKTTHAKATLSLLVLGEATIISEGKMSGQNMRLRFFLVTVRYIIHPGLNKKRRFCSLLAVFRDESPNSPVPHCHNDQYQFEWAARPSHCV